MDEYVVQWIMKTCPVCGKEFLPASQHYWRIGSRKGFKLVCSYTCMRQWEKNLWKVSRRKNDGKKVKVDETSIDESQ